MLLKFLKLIGKLFNRISKRYRIYDSKTFLLVPKGRFILGKREDTTYDIIDDFINDVESYDYIWRSNKFKANYFENSRVAFYKDTILLTKSFIIEHSEQKNNLRIIDVGIGTGYFLKLLNDELTDIDFTLYGIDFSPASIENGMNLLPSGIFKVGNIHSIEYVNEYFDFIFCMEVLEHIQFVEKAIFELYRICKKGGYIAISIPNGILDSWFGHINFWSIDEFHQMLNKLKLNIAEFRLVDKHRTQLYILSK